MKIDHSVQHFILRILLGLLFFNLVCFQKILAQSETLSRNELERVLEAGKNPRKRIKFQRLIELIDQRKIDFVVTSFDEKEIRRNGNYLTPKELNELLSALRSSYSKIQISFDLAEDAPLWNVADEDFMNRRGKPVRNDIISYHGFEDAEILAPGLWVGDITSNVQDLLRKTFLERSIFSIIMPGLRKAKTDYLQSQERTASLDKAWNLIPDGSLILKDQAAFNNFARVLYPNPSKLNDPTTITRRDELIKSLEKFWKLPGSQEEDVSDEVYTAQIIYNLLLWYKDPVFRLRITNKDSAKIALDKIEIVVEDFKAFADTGVSGPIQQLIKVNIKLNADKSKQITSPLNVGIASGDVGDVTVKFESTQKGVYQLKIKLFSNGNVIWEGKSFNLFFNIV